MQLDFPEHFTILDVFEKVNLNFSINSDDMKTFTDIVFYGH